MHVALPPPQPPSCPQQMERARATTLFAVMVVAFGAWGPMCVVVCAQVGLHACRVAGVKVRGAKEVHVHHVCRRFLCVQLVLSTCICVCVDNDDPALVKFFVTV